MPYLVIKSWYPTNLISETTKKYLEVVQKYPPATIAAIGETLVPVASKTTKKGVKTMSIYEVTEGKLEEALTLASNAMAMFNDFEGYEYSIETWATVSEALAVQGIKAPER